MSNQDVSSETTSNYERLDPDVRLMLEVRDDNAVAYEKLVKKYESRVVGFLQNMVSRDQAEDLAQEVFMRVFRARKSYVPGARFSTWLFTITHNVASNAIRKISRTMEINLNQNTQSASDRSLLEEMALSASGQMPTRRLDRLERAEIVRVAIQSLNERQRTAVLLSKFEGMSYQEIGDTMGLSSQAVKSLLSRARASLREILEPYFDTGVLPPSLSRMDETRDPTN